MSSIAPGVAPLSQALSRKRSNALPILLLGLGLIAAIAFAALGFLESRRTESVLVVVRPVPFGQQIVAEDLGSIALPLHRPTQLAGMADPGLAVGKYAAHDLHADAVVQPTMLLDAPPEQPVFPNGQALASNMVPLPFATLSIGPLTAHDRVNLGFSDRTGSPDLCDQAKQAAAGAKPTIAPMTQAAQPRPFACRLLSSVRVLYVDDSAGVAYLELTPFQAHTVRALQAAGLELWGERYGRGSEILPALERLDIGQVSVEQLNAPVEAPAEDADEAAVPGADSAIPGARP
jgi:hypothetical protein